MNKIKILGFDYEINEVESPTLDGEECYGMVDNIACIIQLEKDNPPQWQAITLLHEIIHAILFIFDHDKFGLNDETEEKVANAIAKGLYQIVKDNGTDFLNYKQSKN